MADGEGSGGEGGGSSESLPMDDLVEAMLRNSQALAAALARREAADRVQRESWEAALKEKDAQIDRLRAEAADAKKKLQADAGRKMRWEAAYELLRGANQKLAELRDGDMEDSRTCAETPSFKEGESCSRLNQNTVDQAHIASDLSMELRKLKQDYETLSSKKDKEVSALLSENDSLHSQLDIMQQDYAEVLKNKKVEAEQATEAAVNLQKRVDELKVLAQKEIDRLHTLVKEKDDEIKILKGRLSETIHTCKDINDTHKKTISDHPSAKGKSENNGLGQMVEEHISEIETVENDMQAETSQKRKRASSLSNHCLRGTHYRSPPTAPAGAWRQPTGSSTSPGRPRGGFSRWRGRRKPRWTTCEQKRQCQEEAAGDSLAP